MRKIKFEYGFESVNGIIKKLYYLHEIPNIKEKCDVWNRLPIVYTRQYTGLKDKNGVEIYEGDKLLINGLSDYINTEYVVEWGFSGFRVMGKQNIQNQSFPNVTFIEVIGNIHENQELIN